MKRLLYRVAGVVVVTHALVSLPLPHVPGACVTVKNAVVILASVIILGKVLYDTLFLPRGPWGRHP